MSGELAFQTPSDIDDGATKSLNDEGLFETIKEWVTADIAFSSAWRTRARQDIEFAEGGKKQWDETAIKVLEEEERPIVTFNKTNKYIRAICGIEANNRHETSFLPRELDNEGEVAANELLSAGSEWMEDGCHAQRHQSRAFRFAATCGMGWTEAIIDHDEDPNGLYSETNVHPCEMVWDKDARDQNLLDSKRRARIRRMKISDARNLIPNVTDDTNKFTDDDLDASWAAEVTEGKPELKTKAEKELRAESRIKDDPNRMVTIVQIQWWEYEPYYQAVDPKTFQRTDMSVEDYDKLNRQYGAQIPSGKWPGVKMRRKVYKQAFVGDRVLKSGPCPFDGGFTFECITWEPNEDGTWSGLVRDLRDPQTWGNKFFAQLMHIINSTAKGGIIAEEDAFADVEEAKRNYPKPSGIVVVKSGAIAKGKIMAKPGQGFTAGVLNLIQITDKMFSDVTGINLEMMGLADRDQAGVLEAQRKQAAMTILATLFDSLALFRERIGRIRLHYMQTVLADGRLIRVAGQDKARAIALITDKVMGKYDVVVSEAPTSPNSKEKIWASIQTLLPPLMQQGMVTGEHVMVLLDYVPGIPSKLVQTFREMAKQPNPERDEAQERAKAMEDAEIKDKQASGESKRAGAILSLAKAGAAQAGIEAEQARLVLETLMGAQSKPMMLEANEQVMGPEQGGPPPPQRLPAMDEQQAQPMEQTSAPNGLAMPGGLMNGLGG